MLTYDSENLDNVAATNLTVTVKRNEYKPRFNQGEYSKTILEIQPIGSTVLRVSASDQNKVPTTSSTYACILILTITLTLFFFYSPCLFPSYMVAGMIFQLHVVLSVSSPALSPVLIVCSWHASILFSVVLSSFSLVRPSSTLSSVCVRHLSSPVQLPS